jgi:hypothetical protein
LYLVTSLMGLVAVVGAGEIGGSGSAAGSKIGDGSTSKRRKKRSSSRNKKNVKRKSEGSNLEGEDGNDHGDTNDVNHDANSVDNIRHHEDDHQGHDHDNQGHWQPETETNNIGDNNTSTNTSKRKKKKNRVLPPRAVIQGKGKYLGRKLMWPRTGKEWLAWGHILQKRVESVRIGRVDRKKDRKEVEARDEAYFEVIYLFTIFRGIYFSILLLFMCDISMISIIFAYHPCSCLLTWRSAQLLAWQLLNMANINA